MASQERIEQLEGFAAGWRGLLHESQQQYSRLMSLMKNLDLVRDKGMIELINKQIVQERNAETEYQKAITLVESNLALARSGDDV